MYELKKMERYLRVNLWDRALVSWKENLPSRGLKKVEKNCYIVSECLIPERGIGSLYRKLVSVGCIGSLYR